jgi:hypothetical protein
MGLVFLRPERIQPLPEPGFLRPGPVTIRVSVELWRFHGGLTMAQQAVCHILKLGIAAYFCEITGMIERKLLVALTRRQILNVQRKTTHRQG